MRRFSSLLALGVMVATGVATAPTSSATVGTLVADYRFVDSLNSSVSGAPALELVGTGTGFGTQTIEGVSDRVLTWQSGSGLRLPQASTIVGESYTMVLLIRSEYLPDTQGRDAKIVDWHDGMSLNGLYLTRRCLSCTDGVTPLVPPDTGPSFITPNSWTQLAIVRHPSTSAAPGGIQLRTYLDGNPAAARADDAPGGPASSCEARVGGCDGSLGNAIRFFLTHTSNTSEPIHQASGAVARIRIYSGAMTQAEIQALDGAGGDGQPSASASPSATSPAPSTSPTTTSTPTPEPSPTESGPVRQCNDGRDNDGDGKTDLNDGGCERGLDDDERNTIKVKSKLTAFHSYSPHQFYGKVSSKRRECIKGRLVYVRTFANDLTDRTDQKGNWLVPHTSGGSDNYAIAIYSEKIKTKREIIKCSGAPQKFLSVS